MLTSQEHPGREDPTSGGKPQTLGDVLYGRPEVSVAPEGEWLDLVRRTAAGELVALHGLYERCARLVFVLALRITGRRRTAEDVTIDVFADIWRRAWAYDAAGGTVLAWVMNQGRTRAREHARFATPGREEPAPGDAACSDDLSPSPSVQSRLARRIADQEAMEPTPPPPAQWREPAWERVADGISCKLLANDSERERVSMLVRLDPGADYPPHTHAGLEELHLLDGRLQINESHLQPGDYNRAEAPSGDQKVWSPTGCTCVLITSTADRLA